MANWFKRKKDADDGFSLSDITRGMQHSACRAVDVIAQQYIRLIRDFFEEVPGSSQDGGTTLKAKTVEMQLDGKHAVHVPLISLVTPRGICLSRMKVRLALRMDETERAESVESCMDTKTYRTRFKVSPAPQQNDEHRNRSGNVMDVEMEFEMKEPPEGVMRVIDEFTNRIHPHSLEQLKQGGAAGRSMVSLTSKPKQTQPDRSNE